MPVHRVQPTKCGYVLCAPPSFHPQNLTTLAQYKAPTLVCALFQNTRNGVLSSANPYYYSGSAGAGVGGPHNGYGYVWPMSLIMKAITSTVSAGAAFMWWSLNPHPHLPALRATTQNTTEIADTLGTIVASSACTGLMHESFQANSFGAYTRPWFAWANSLLGELILQLAEQHPSLIFKA